MHWELINPLVQFGWRNYELVIDWEDGSENTRLPMKFDESATAEDLATVAQATADRILGEMIVAQETPPESEAG